MRFRRRFAVSTAVVRICWQLLRVLFDTVVVFSVRIIGRCYVDLAQYSGGRVEPSARSFDVSFGYCACTCVSPSGRYYLVQRAREAGVIGIVVGTLGVQLYGSVVRSLRRMVEDAGRKAYTLAVGKVNVAKLANFAEVRLHTYATAMVNSKDSLRDRTRCVKASTAEGRWAKRRQIFFSDTG